MKNFLMIGLMSLSMLGAFSVQAADPKPAADDKAFQEYVSKMQAHMKLMQEQMQKMQKEMTPFYALQFFLTLFSTFSLVNLAVFTPFSLYHVAFWIWLGFIVPTQIAGVIWGSTKKKFWFKQILIMVTYQLLGIMLGAFILLM